MGTAGVQAGTHSSRYVLVAPDHDSAIEPCVHRTTHNQPLHTLDAATRRRAVQACSRGALLRGGCTEQVEYEQWTCGIAACWKWQRVCRHDVFCAQAVSSKASHSLCSSHVWKKGPAHASEQPCPSCAVTRTCCDACHCVGGTAAPIWTVCKAHPDAIWAMQRNVLT